MLKFSLVVPTRERPVLAFRFMDSIWRNTTNKEDIEILFAVDEDDSISKDYVRSFQSKYGPRVKMFERPRTEFINRDYYNWLAEKAEGELVWIMADDLEIIQPGWDVLVWEAAQAYLADKPDRVVCISIKDNTPVPRHDMPKFPCFPMFTKEAIKFFGWALHPSPPNWGVDYICYNIYYYCGRLLQIHNTNYINHISWHTKQVAEDKTNLRIGHIFNKLKMIPKHNTDRILSEEVPIFQQRLQAHIQHCRDKATMKEERHDET